MDASSKNSPGRTAGASAPPLSTIISVRRAPSYENATWHAASSPPVESPPVAPSVHPESAKRPPPDPLRSP
eukprot:1180840-Prorocentrum_minimum.AAC.3